MTVITSYWPLTRSRRICFTARCPRRRSCGLLWPAPRVRRLLILLDTCYSGRGGEDLAREALRRIDSASGVR